MSASGMHKMMKRISRRAGKPEVSMHWLRHACASHLLHAGADLASCRDHLGHASIQTTNTYLFGKTDIASFLD